MSETVKTNWKHNDIVTEHDFNRIEKSINDAHQPAYITKTYQQKAFSMPEEAVSGFVKSIEIKGQSVFNIIPKLSDYNNDNIADGWSFMAGYASTQYNFSDSTQTFYGNDDHSVVFRSDNLLDNDLSIEVFYGVWVKSNSSTAEILYGGTPSSRYHSGNGTWEYLYVKQIGTGNTKIHLKLNESDASKYIQFKDPIAINISALQWQNCSANLIHQRIPKYFEGLAQVESTTVNSCGKNLLNTNTFFDNLISISKSSVSEVVENNRNCYLIDQNITAFYLKDIYDGVFQPNKQYTITVEYKHGSTTGLYLGFYYTDGTTTGILGSESTFTKKSITSQIEKTVQSIRVVNYNSNFGKTYINKDNIQLEEGTIATIYEPYKTSTPINITKIGYSLPNGVSDRAFIQNGKWYREQNVGVKELQSSDITSLVTSGFNADYVTIPVSTFVNAINLTDEAPPSTVYEGKTKVVAVGLDDTTKIGAYGIGTVNMVIVLAKSTYTDLATSQSDLTGKKVLYQLATPIITELDINPNFLVHETLWIETDKTVPGLDIEYCGNLAAVREQNMLAEDSNMKHQLKKIKKNQIKTIMGVV